MIKQKQDEFDKLLQIIKSRGVTNILEIGTFDGESAIEFSKAIHGHVTTIDPYAKPKLPYNIKQISGYSQSPGVINEVAPLAPFDFVFIDGDHRRADQDFDIYKNFVSPGGMIGFHDINPRANITTYPVVPFWDSLKSQYPHLEIISDQDLRPGYGIGLLFGF